VPQQGKANVAMYWRCECLFVVSTKFVFIRIEYSVRSNWHQQAPDQQPASAGSAAGLVAVKAL
jgi:hypothetical protein